MPGFPFPGRPGGEHDEPLLDMIIARRVLPPDAPRAVHDLERMLAALAGPAEPGELASEAAVRAAFRQATSPAGVSSAARRPGHRRAGQVRRVRGPARSRARLATVLVAAVAGLGSVLAAYTDLLPSPIQQLAHVTVAAPAPHSQSGGAGVGRTSARPIPSTTSQPAPGPDHSAVPTQPPRQAQTPTPHYRGLSSSPGHRRAQPICTPGSWRAGLPTTRPTSLPSSAPSQGQRCTGYPTIRPTPNQYVH